MKLSEDDLRQMDEGWLKSQLGPVLLEVLKRLLSDLKLLRDRQNQGTDNSLAPPGSQLPWDKLSATGMTSKPPAAPANEAEVPDTAQEAPPKEADTKYKASAEVSCRAHDKPLGAARFGRTQKLAFPDTRERRPEHCAACKAALDARPTVQAYSAWDEVDIGQQPAWQIGLLLTVTRHQLLTSRW